MGSAFAPVAGERFDLIVANPPYVVSPDSAYLYRDSGEAGDAFCQRLVRQAPRFLREGGWATILCQWVHRREDEDWWVPPSRWIRGDGFDAWLFRYRSYDPADYAATWNDLLRLVDPAEHRRALVRWRAHYRRLGVESIGSGAVLLRRRSALRNWLRADELPEPAGPAGEQLLRMADIQDYLAGLGDVRRLMGARLACVPNHRVMLGFRYRGGSLVRCAILRVDDALAFQVGADAGVVGLLPRLDGRRRLRDAIGKLSRTAGGTPARWKAALLPSVRRLLRFGLLRPVGRA